jgi:hypothetical protein
MVSKLEKLVVELRRLRGVEAENERLRAELEELRPATLPPPGWLPLKSATSERLTPKQIQYGFEQKFIERDKFGGRWFYDPASLLRYEELKGRK